MTPIDIRKAIDEAINKLYCLSGQCNSDPLIRKFANARKHLKAELELIDVQVIRSLDEEAA